MSWGLWCEECGCYHRYDRLIVNFKGRTLCMSCGMFGVDVDIMVAIALAMGRKKKRH